MTNRSSRNIARGFEGGYSIVEPDFPQRDFAVSLHWSRRFEADPAISWLRALVEELFGERGARFAKGSSSA
jgi:hypothetical protein